MKEIEPFRINRSRQPCLLPGNAQRPVAGKAGSRMNREPSLWVDCSSIGEDCQLIHRQLVWQCGEQTAQVAVDTRLAVAGRTR